MTVGAQRPTYAVVPGWGKLPDGWSFIEATAVAVDSKDNVYVYNRGAHPVIIFDRTRQVSALLGRGDDQPRPRHHDRSRRHGVADRRRQPHDPASTPPDGKPAPVDRRSRPAGARARGEALQPADPRRALAPDRGPLHLGRLRQLASPQVRPEGPAPLLVGRAGHGSRLLQHPAQHRDRLRGARVRGGPGEPSRPGVRREGPLPVPDQQPPPGLRRSTSTAGTAGGSSWASCPRICR